jgi:16S rRNA (guanine527-N7)-methyltransferase
LNTNPLQTGLDALGLTLTAAQQQQCLDYLALIQKWNQVYNLTAVRNPAEMLTHHLLDCLAVIAPLVRHTQGRPTRLLDVGSGAGLPGVVIALCRPEIDVTCVDTVSKKAAFIQQAAGTLKLPNLHGVHARVEALKADPFDVVTSRAFSSLADLVSLTLFHVKPAADVTQGVDNAAGVWMAMKGKHPEGEMEALPPDVAVFHVEPLTVPGLDAERCLVWMRKKP